MGRKYKILAVTATSLAVIDQVLKLLVLRYIPEHSAATLIQGFAYLTHVENTGAAFGIFQGMNSAFFIGISLVALVVIFGFFRGVRSQQTLSIVSLSLVLGGAVGNLIDRVFRGAVVDFIDLRWHGYSWPAFNLADSAITIGVVMLIIELLTVEAHQKRGAAAGRVESSATEK